MAAVSTIASGPPAASDAVAECPSHSPAWHLGLRDVSTCPTPTWGAEPRLRLTHPGGTTRDVTPHGLRHAHASWLLAGGADVQVVKERLGHASITTTEKYLHTLPTADDAALAALDRIRAPRV